VRRTIHLTLNGRSATVETEETANLLDVLRGELGIAGARFGCGLGQCGACAVLVDGQEQAACAMEIGAVDGRVVLTAEGLGTIDDPHPLHTAFLELQAGQCGYCLSGILMSARGLLDANPRPSRAEIRAALAGTLCRCGVMDRMVRAVERASDEADGDR
jgi:nicotinate dehydrogenase subunit A